MKLKKIGLVIVVICFFIGVIFYIPKTYLGVAAPTKDGCDVCNDPSGEISYVSMKKRGENILDIEFDTYSSVYSGSKSDYSQAGNYGLKDDPNGSGISWYQHVENLEDYIIENDQFPEVDDDGYIVDGVSSCTINVEEFENAYEQMKPRIEIHLQGQEDGYKNLFTE